MYTPAVALFLATLFIAGTQYAGIYLRDTAPDKTELGQTASNKCAGFNVAGSL